MGQWWPPARTAPGRHGLVPVRGSRIRENFPVARHPYHRAVDSAGNDPGRRRAEELLDALAYDELRAMAARVAALGRWPDRDPTSLLHEALANWMRRGDGRVRSDRDGLVASMVTVLRNAAIDRARRRSAASLPVPTDPSLLDDGPGADRPAPDRETLVALAAAVDELRQRAPRPAMALELRFHAGLEVSEVAAALGVSLAQAKRDIAAAKAFVRMRLAADGEAAPP